MHFPTIIPVQSLALSFVPFLSLKRTHARAHTHTHTQSLEDIEAVLGKAERSMKQLKCKVASESLCIR
jgi:hypothetical protein